MAKKAALSDDDVITIHNVDGKHKYSDFRGAVVRLSDGFYLKTDPAVVKIRNNAGKIRFFRAESPMLVTDPSGNRMIKSESVLTEDGLWLNPKGSDVVKVDGVYTRKSYTVTIDKKLYKVSDPRIAVDYQGNYDLIENLVLLAPYYGKGVKASTRKMLLVEDESHQWWSQGDCQKVWDCNKDDFTWLPPDTRRSANVGKIVLDFQDLTNPQEDRLTWVGVINHRDKLIQMQLGPGSSEVPILKSKQDYFQNICDTIIMPRYLQKSEELRRAMNNNYSDAGPDENNAKVVSHVSKPWPGKHNIHTAMCGRPTQGKKYKLTGGLGYSFGVEFETSDGVLPTELSDLHMLNMVGDRSIGAAEYVTRFPLLGSDGINHIKAMCAALSKHCLVDDRCGLHVHVGSLGEGYSSPSFDRQFLINSIKLGALLEEELYKSLPPSRVPTLYHCHSILRYKPISRNNWRQYLGAFVFGRKELWYEQGDGGKARLSKPIVPFPIEDYSYGGPGQGPTSHVGQWADARYKWLNLINCATHAEHKTIEFRIFSGTTSFEKVYAYILTSLAFTWFVDNRPGFVQEGVKLEDVFRAAFAGPKRADILDFILAFYKDRTARFNRKEIYPKNIPFEI